MKADGIVGLAPRDTLGNANEFMTSMLKAKLIDKRIFSFRLYPYDAKAGE